MSGYIKDVLHNFQRPLPERPEHTPHVWNASVYGANTHFVDEPQDTPLLLPKEVTQVEKL
jgi:hypothetical protein